MKVYKRHNTISQSVLTLPVCLLLALVLWWFPQRHYSHDYLANLLLMLLTALIITGTNARYHILRVRSYMMMAAWMFGTTMVTFLHPFKPEGSHDAPMMAACCLAMAYHLLFRTYQKSNPVVDAFHIFFMLGVGSIVMPYFVLLAPFILWHIAVFMRSLSLRTFFASLIGFLLPFWIWISWLLWKENPSPALDWWYTLNHIETLHYFKAVKALGMEQLIQAVPFLTLTVLTLWTTVYYLMHSYDDKIQIRMVIYVYIMQAWIIILLTVLTLNVVSFTPLLLLSICPLLAHYFTLCDSRTSLVVFWLALWAFVIIFVNTVVDITPILNYFTTFASKIEFII